MPVTHEAAGSSPVTRAIFLPRFFKILTMHVQPLYQSLQVFAALPSWVAAHLPAAGELCFDALPPDLSFNALPTYAVRVTAAGREIGVYKCNLAQFTGEDGRNCALFSPLVVTWRDGHPPKGDISRRIIDHCVKTARGFCPPETGVIVTSGNLTRERAGLPFFTALGWEIVTEKTARREIERTVLRGLEKAAAGFLEDADKPVSCAVLEL